MERTSARAGKRYSISELIGCCPDQQIRGRNAHGNDNGYCTYSYCPGSDRKVKIVCQFLNVEDYGKADLYLAGVFAKKECYGCTFGNVLRAMDQLLSFYKTSLQL